VASICLTSWLFAAILVQIMNMASLDSDDDR
jgi:hypothetical protein